MSTKIFNQYRNFERLWRHFGTFKCLKAVPKHTVASVYLRLWWSYSSSYNDSYAHQKDLSKPFKSFVSMIASLTRKTNFVSTNQFFKFRQKMFERHWEICWMWESSSYLHYHNNGYISKQAALRSQKFGFEISINPE